MKATYFLQATQTEQQTEADCTLCERRGGGHGPDRVAVGNSIFSVSTSNNSQLGAPRHILPVKVLNITRCAPNQSPSVISVYLFVG